MRIFLKFAIKKLAEKTAKSLCEVLKRGRLHKLSIQCQVDLFDKSVQPILLLLYMDVNSVDFTNLEW